MTTTKELRIKKLTNRRAIRLRVRKDPIVLKLLTLTKTKLKLVTMTSREQPPLERGVEALLLLTNFTLRVIGRTSLLSR